ncbi:MAG: type II toxin-antitoxin system mRNA interferase toxin, RelE/StbE family [Alphaproteobacteria bacterium]|nr:type II toxin-antitoxin system mRNA interferase toxin, RelE/StbE family [Alphaproteobacteria bacterium]
MTWRIEWDDRARRELRRLDRRAQQHILTYLRARVGAADNPRSFGKAPRGGLAWLWRYRVGDNRIICRLEDQVCIVLVVGIRHRGNIYD